VQKKVMIGLLGVLLLVLAACASGASSPAARLDPKVQLTMEADGRTVVRVGACNVNTEDFAGDRYFEGQVNVFDENDCLVEGAKVQRFGPVASHQTVFPLEIRTALPQGSYRLTYNTSSYGFAITYFSVVEQDGARYLKANSRWVCPKTDFTIVTGD
jgi:hypothetical protein